MRKLFTLIELIVVIVVIGILAAIVVPNISSQQTEATVSAVKGNIRNLQTSVDMYALKNNGKYPAKETPKYFVPQPINFEELHPEYTRTIPKTKGFKYWVDAWGIVWGSSVDAPTEVKIDTTEKALVWEEVEGAESYQVYELSGYTGAEVIGKAGRARLSNPKEITEEKYKGETGKAYVVTAVDEYGFETAPSGVGYLGYKDSVTSIPSTPIIVCDEQGSGTIEDPFIICTEDGLYNIRNNLNAHYKLGKDIVITKWQEGTGWEPIGMSPAQFKGSFDGGNHSIENLFINNPTQSSVGLFGNAANSTLKNIAIKNAKVTGNVSVGALVGAASQNSKIENVKVSGVIHGNSYVGGIAGMIRESSILNADADITVTSVDGLTGGIVGHMNYINNQVVNSHSSGSVSGKWNIGGIAGFASDANSISNSSSNATVSGTNHQIGGIVGHGEYTFVVSNSSYNGTVKGGVMVGGIAGGMYAGASVKKSHSEGTVSSMSAGGGIIGEASGAKVEDSYSLSSITASNAGGIIGEAKNGSSISRTYYSGVIKGTTNSNGIVGSKLDTSVVQSSYWNKDIAGSTITSTNYAKTNAEMKLSSTYMGWDFTSIWHIQEGNSYPILR